MKILDNLDISLNQLLNAQLQNVAGDTTVGKAGALGATDKGLFWQNTATGQVRTWDGAAYQNLTNVLEGVTGTGAITAGAIAGKSQAISIAAASASVPGTMTAAHYSLVAGATNIATGSTLVLRDGTGNFSAGVITAALTGTASNATNLNNQPDTFYLARANHTGSQLAATVSNFDTQVRTSRLDQMAAPTAAVPLGGQKITGLAIPTLSTDAATKGYVDGISQGLDTKASVRLASAGVTVAGLTYNATGGTSGRGQMTTAPNALDGVNLAVNDRLLLKDMTSGAQNAIWVVTTLGTGANGVWDLATDFDTDPEVTAGAYVFVEEGTVNADTGWVLATNNPITVGGASGTVLTWTQFSSAGAVIGGGGLVKTGNTLDVIGTAGRITVNPDSIDISAAYVGQATITTLGTITAGVWTGTTIALLNGGTGATTAAGARTALGALTKFAATLGAITGGVGVVVNHNLNTVDVTVAVQDTTTKEIVYMKAVVTDANNVTVTFAATYSTGLFRVTVVG
jgi:hypothetical protein